MFDSLRRYRIIKRKLTKLGLEKAFVQAILKTYVTEYVFNKGNRRSDLTRIGKYSVKYGNYEDFLLLFSSLFIGQEYLTELGKADPFIVHCGSNIGLSVIYFKNLCPHSRIIAFEPDALSYSCLKTNVQQNRFSSVESHKKALSDFEGFRVTTMMKIDRDLFI